MFKSASTSQFQNPSYNSSSFLAQSSVLYEPKSPTFIKPKKTAVKFEIENYKQNTKQMKDDTQSLNYQRIHKRLGTWSQKRIPQQKPQICFKSPLKDSNFNKSTKQENKYGQSIKSPTDIKNYLSSQGFDKLSKKYSQNPGRQNQEKQKFQRSNKQCKSMKILPSFNPDEQDESINWKAKKQKKYEKLEAYNNLLKSSEELIQKYKKLQDEKMRLKMDLKNQVQNHSKSSKKIVFLQQKQAQNSKQIQNIDKKYSKLSSSQVTYQTKFSNQTSYLTSYDKKQSSYNNTSSTCYQIKYPNNTSSKYLYQSKAAQSPSYTINNDFQKFNKYSAHQNKYDSKYTNKFEIQKSKSPYSKGLNKTFSNKSFYNDSNTLDTYSKFQSKTYSSSFGVTKSPSSKKLSLTGLSLDDFQLGKCLGSGAFGQVFPARHKKTNWLFALKKVQKLKVKHMLDQFIQEIKIQLFLDHPNVVKLYSFFDDSLYFYIVMQYMQGGSLYSYLKKKKTLTVEQTSQKLRQVCEGLQHMHDNQILHRDIKPQNIVLSHGVSKLCDFGWSAICKDRRTTYCGTLDYVSPQIIQGQGYDDSVDIWCIGVLAYELIVGKTPFYNISRKETMKKIMDCELQYPSTMPSTAVSFIRKILKKNPEQRRTIQQVLKDPLLKQTPQKTTTF